MIERILIDSIKINRVRDPGDDIEAFAEDIRVNGLRVPVLLSSGDLELVDGLRRLEAVSLLGAKTIKADIAGTLEEAVENLALASAEQPQPARRMWQIRTDLQGLLDERMYRQRSRTYKNGRRKDPDEPSSRQLFERAFGDYRPFEILLWIYRWAAEGHPEGPAFIAALESGELTPAAARLRILKLQKKERGTVATAEDQKYLMETAVRQITNAIKAFDQIKLPIRVSPSEMKKIMDENKRNRADIYRLVRLLEEAASDDNQ